MKDIAKREAIRFVVFIGIVSMFADITYEGARSITGPFLGSLGANAVIIGFVAGFGEFLGYSMRLVSGYLSDRSQRYWLVAIIGYVINLFSVPLIGLTSSVAMAGLLIICERTGKGIRVPARDAMLSHAASRMGMGWGFGLHEALDQAGAMTGPLFIAALLFYYNNYHLCFLALVIPAILALITLILCWLQYPQPQKLELFTTHSDDYISLRRNFRFWLLLLGSGLIAFGYADFALIAFHFAKINLFPNVAIPAIYALSLGSNIIMAPLLGKLFDRYGGNILLAITFISAFFAPLVFLGSTTAAIVGCVLWGIGVGAQASLLRAVIAHMIPSVRRGFAYGAFNAAFGAFWFAGSIVLGFLYDYSISYLVIVSLLAQLMALPILHKAMKSFKYPLL